MAERRDYVQLTSSLLAKTSPSFLIRGSDDRLYLTVAVIEYDRNAIENEYQKRGVALMWDLFEKVRGVGESERMETYTVDTSGWTALNVEPPGVGTDPPGVGTDPPGVGTQSEDSGSA